MTVIRRLAAIFVVLIPMLAAAEPQKKLQPAGHIDVILGELGDGSLSYKTVENELSKSRNPRIVGKAVDHEFDLAPDVLFRRQNLPKTKDGKAKTYSNSEYAELRKPLGAPGYAADRSDFKPGQIVRLFLGRETPKDRAVVMYVMLIKDAPSQPKKPEDKKAPKKPGDKNE